MHPYVDLLPAYERELQARDFPSFNDGGKVRLLGCLFLRGSLLRRAGKSLRSPRAGYVNSVGFKILSAGDNRSAHVGIQGRRPMVRVPMVEVIRVAVGGFCGNRSIVRIPQPGDEGSRSDGQFSRG